MITKEKKLDEFLSAQNLLEKKGIAIAINNEVVPRSEWEMTNFKENDQLLVITAAAGG